MIEGTNEYTTCQGLLTASSPAWPRSALLQIAASGIPLNKLVIGKPAIPGDAGSGFIDQSTLATCVSQAKQKGWSELESYAVDVILLTVVCDYRCRCDGLELIGLLLYSHDANTQQLDTPSSRMQPPNGLPLSAVLHSLNDSQGN